MVLCFLVALVSSDLQEVRRREASNPTVELLEVCSRSEQEVVIGVAAGEGREDMERWLVATIGAKRVAGPDLVDERLWGAAETDDFDFASFQDVDAIVGGLAAAHWQELMATYPRAKLILVLGHTVTPAADQTARLTRCAESKSTMAVDVSVARWGSACPSKLQMAKVDDQNVHEMLASKLPNERFLVIDQRDGFFVDDSQMIKEFLLGKATRPTEVIEWRIDFSGLIRRRPGRLIICAGAGATATKSLAKALRYAGFQKIDHYKQAVDLLGTAAETDGFDFGVVFGSFDAVLDTPIPGYWRELFESFDDAKVILTIRDAYDRGYASRFDARDLGITNADWVNARASPKTAAIWADISFRKHNRTTRFLLEEESTCRDDDCDAACRRFVDDARKMDRLDDAGSILSVLGDHHCRLSKPLDVVQSLAVAPAAMLLRRHEEEFHNGLRNSHKARVPVYNALCPSWLTAVKAYHNHNRHVLRSTPADRLLVMDITKGDGFDILCPFLNIPSDRCPTGPFPHSKDKNKSPPPSPPGGRRRLDPNTVKTSLHDRCICDVAADALRNGLNAGEFG